MPRKFPPRPSNYTVPDFEIIQEEVEAEKQQRAVDCRPKPPVLSVPEIQNAGAENKPAPTPTRLQEVTVQGYKAPPGPIPAKPRFSF